MNFKKTIFISILLLFLSVAAVSAADLNDTYVTESSGVDDSLSIEDSFVESSQIQDSEVLSYPKSTFADLQEEINDAPAGSVLFLNEDYDGYEGAVVHIDKDLTINGKGHTIDCKSIDTCIAFTSNCGIITLKNLNIINGCNDEDGWGGAMIIEGSAQYTIENCTFINNRGDFSGGIYHNSDKGLVVKNCLFQNNVADASYGAISSNSGNLAIYNSIFENCEGGAIFVDDVDDDEGSIIDGCTFTNNWKNTPGGAIYYVSYAPLTVRNSLFKYNKATWSNGGAICAASYYLEVHDSVFENNEAIYNGGAIDGYYTVNMTGCSFISNNVDTDYLGEDSNGAAVNARDIYAYNCTFRNNIAESYGGALYGINSVNAYHCLFESNIAEDEDGGAIYSQDAVNIVDCTFKDNWADDYAGAIYSENTVYIDFNQNSSFTTYFINNIANDDDGGAIYAKGDVIAVNARFSANSANCDGGAICGENSVTLNNCLFESNHADDNGGAVCCENTVTVNNCLFGSNAADDDGGAIKGSDVNIVNSTFNNNYAGDYGGAIYAANVYINANQVYPQAFNTFFTNNKADEDKGGAIYAEGTVKTINAIFSGNSAEDSDGGAIYSKDVIAYNCAFNNNYAENYGGAICSENNVNADNCLFESNKADDNGGSIYTNDATVNKCIFKNNWADDNGGAIYATDLTLENTPSLFGANTAYKGKGGAIYTNKFKKDVKYASFIGNRAGDGATVSDDGGAIYIGDECWLSFESCYFVNNHCTDEGGAIYLDNDDSKLSLVNNIFMGNGADDEGTAVFNCGEYVIIKNNWWGQDYPIFDNVLVEWHSGKSNENHYDTDYLCASLKVGSTHTNVNSSIPIEIKLFSLLDGSISPVMTGLENFILSTNNNGEFKDYNYGQNTIKAVYTPKNVGTHQITINGLFNPGKGVAASLYVDENSTGPDGKEQVIDNIYLSFTELQALINNAPAGSVLNLTRNYHGDEGAVVHVDKDLTIDGQGHTIDCLNAEGCIAFYSNSGNITLKNLRIINGNSVNNNEGVAISIHGSAQYTIENCIFENILAESSGAIKNRVNKTLTIKDCTFNSISSQVSGGAVYSMSSVVVKNSVFDSCIAEGDSSGGAIVSYGGIFEDCIFRNNFASYSGAAIVCYYEDLYINRCLFENNKVDGQIVHDSYAGAVHCLAKNLYINNSTFKNNWADDYAGAVSGENIYINYDQDANQSFNTFFINNVAEDIKGGAIECSGNLYMKNAVFSSNKAYVDGGAIYARNDVTMSHCLFESNSADGADSQCYGGAVCAVGNVYVDNSTFKDNYAHDYGGAIYAANVYINTNQAYPRDFNSFFINNKLNDDKGGAIYAEVSVNAVNAVFSGNRAEDSDGGAIYAEDVTANNCAFNNNYAENYGGAICGDNVKVNKCLFESNKADDHGGAIYAKDATVNECTFNNNWAEDNGGAIYSTKLLLENTPSLFKYNTAYTGKGGAIYANEFKKDVKYASFIGNRAGDGATISDDGGAIYINDECWLSFESCLFINNHCTDEGGAIYLDDDDSKLSLVNNIFMGNGADDEGTAVFNCGEYVIIKNNWWGEDLPLFDNVLVEWHGVKSNENHHDSDPLRASLKVGSTHTNVNSSIPVEIKLYSAIDMSISPKITGLENFIFSTNNNGAFKDYYYGQNTIKAVYTPKSVGTHQISVKDLFNSGRASVAYLYVDADSKGPDGKEQVIENSDLSFTEFQTMVNNAPDGSVINLNNNFVYSSNDNLLNDKKGIIINKNLVIDGHGHSFDAKSLSGIFQSSQGTITLKNIVFKNGYQVSADDGGAIRILGSARYIITNCTFDSNKALQDGGAIYNEGGDLQLNDCTFVNNCAAGANILNDCDGGAVHTKAPLLLNHCTFKNNYAADNGGAIYATNGITWVSAPSNFVENTAYKAKGGAIYTNVFNNNVRYAVFYDNHAGEGATISDDGGAIYIKDANTVTFSQCAFIINHCSDEGGAIYLESTDSHLTLRNNFFLGNTAGDEGQVVYNKGHFDKVSDNWWADNLPSKDNDLLIQWEPLLLPNWHEVDSHPVYMKLKLTSNVCNVGNSVWATLCFYHYGDGSLCNGEMYTDLIGFLPTGNVELYNRMDNEYYINILVMPLKSGVYTITANLYGQFASATLSAINPVQSNNSNVKIPENHSANADNVSVNDGSSDVSISGHVGVNNVNANVVGSSYVDNSGVTYSNSTNDDLNGSSVAKSINNPQSNNGDNINLWWIILAILAVLAAGGIIKKYKS